MRVPLGVVSRNAACSIVMPVAACALLRAPGPSGALHQFGNRPNAIRNPSRHRWRDAERLVNAAIVIVREVQPNSRLQAFDLF